MSFLHVFNTSQIHHKKDIYHVASLRRLRSQKRFLFCDISDTSQKYLLKVFATKMVSCDLRRVIEISDEIDMGPLKTLKK